MAYLVCDPNKIVRARKTVMKSAQERASEVTEPIVGMSYDGRRNKHTRVMVEDSFGKVRMRMVTEEHESVTQEPCGKYLGHIVPLPGVLPEKPALKVAKGLYDILLRHDSTETLMILGGDPTNTNTGYKGDAHCHLEKLLGRRLFWAICQIFTNKLPLRHLLTAIDGPTSSDKGFQGPDGSLLSKVNQMLYNPDFKALPGGEELISLPEDFGQICLLKHL